MATAQERRRRSGRRTIVFVDEIHRFNKAQQDAFPPARRSRRHRAHRCTTENPSFEVNAALLSRSKVFVLQLLPTHDAIVQIVRRALTDRERGLGGADIVVADGASSRRSPNSPTAMRGRRSTSSSLPWRRRRWIRRRACASSAWLSSINPFSGGHCRV